MLLAEGSRTVLLGFQVDLPWDALLIRWSIALAGLIAGLAAFYFNVVVPIMDAVKENARIQKAKANREVRKQKLEAEKEKAKADGLRRRTNAGSSGESKDTKKEPKKPAALPKKPKRRCNQKRLKNILENAKTDPELGNPTEAEVEEALLENADHAGKAMGWLITRANKKAKKAKEEEKAQEKAKLKLAQQNPELAGTTVGDSVSKHGNHSYYFAHHARDLESEIKPEDFQMNAPKLLKTEKKKKPAELVAKMDDKLEKRNIQNYSWAETEAGRAQVTIPLRAVGELPEENIKLEWEDRWVRISITDYEGADHFFEIRKTYCELKSAELIRKPHKLELVLERKSSFDQWYKLHHPGVIKSADDDDD
jgi:hypothetical protein